jgi:thioredoxin-like negative regulator of GroEL
MNSLPNYISIKNDLLEATIQRNKGLTLVVFVNDGSGICYLLEPTLIKASERFRKECHFYRVDFDSNMMLAATYGVIQLPAILFFHNDRLIDRVCAFINLQDLRHRISQHLSTINLELRSTR